MPKVERTPTEFETVSLRLFGAAWAHVRSAVYCRSNPAAKSPSTDEEFFKRVSSELLLLSVEQSLKLILYLKDVCFDIDHDLYQLYAKTASIQDAHDGNSLIGTVVRLMDEMGRARGYSGFTEEEVCNCLKVHRSLYKDLRYFGVDRKLRPIELRSVQCKDYQTIQWLSLSLIATNLLALRSHEIEVEWPFTTQGEPITASDLTNFLVGLDFSFRTLRQLDD